MVTDIGKFRLAKQADISRRQEEADRAKMRRDGLPAVKRDDPSETDPNAPGNGAVQK